MSRTAVSEKALIEWMNLKLQQHDECKDCRFTSVLRLAGDDQDGCNWSSPNLQCSGVPADVCRPMASHVAGQARELFNLEEP
jgi:hypothetical protein